MAATQGTQCPNLPTGVGSTDAFGDGCLAVNGIFGVGAFSGLVVDPVGNVLVNDDIKGALHLINPNSGIMTLVAGSGTACSSKQDSSGDGCVAATGTPVTPIEDARGIGIDPYGNILLAGFNDHFVHLICRNASPLCGGAPSATSPIQIAIGDMGLVAGCAGSSGSSGASGVGVDNTPGYTTPTPGLFSGSQFVQLRRRWIPPRARRRWEQEVDPAAAACRQMRTATSTMPTQPASGGAWCLGPRVITASPIRCGQFSSRIQLGTTARQNF